MVFLRSDSKVYRFRLFLDEFRAYVKIDRPGNDPDDSDDRRRPWRDYRASDADERSLDALNRSRFSRKKQSLFETVRRPLKLNFNARLNVRHLMLKMGTVKLITHKTLSHTLLFNSGSQSLYIHLC